VNVGLAGSQEFRFQLIATKEAFVRDQGLVFRPGERG